MISIKTLARELLTDSEFCKVIDIAKDKDNLFKSMFLFDLQLGGTGIHNINRENTGRYNVNDRDVYRPFQYIYAYLQMDHEHVEWVTREIVHMCGLHLESLIKRVSFL